MAVESARGIRPSVKLHNQTGSWLDQRWVVVAAPLVLLAVILVLWQVASAAGWVSRLALPAPSDVLQSLIEYRESIGSAAVVTITELGIAVGLAVVVGVVLGFLVAQSEAVRATVFPFLVAIQSAPKIAIAPIALLWFGTGLGTPVLMGFIMAVFPIIVATEVGFRAVHPELHELAASLRASWWSRFSKIMLPSALPSMMSGFKIAVAQSITGIIVAEFVQESAGLGYVIVNAASRGQTSVAFAVLTVLILIALVAIALLTVLERVSGRWMRGYSNS